MDTKSSERNYYLDWLRVLGILAVLIYHSTRFFNMEDWLVKNSVRYPWVEAWNRFATAWLMPLMFIISGASLFYALGKGKENGLKAAGIFVRDKVLRLLVPWVVIILTHQSLQFYLDRLSHGQFSGSYLQYLPQYYTSEIDLGGAHLWYLLLLFVFSVLLYYPMRWLRGLERNMLGRLGDRLSKHGAVYLLALPAMGLSICLDYASHAHNAGWTYVVYLWLVLCGFLLVSHERLQERIQQLRWFSLPMGLVLVGTSIFLLTLETGPAFGTLNYALGWGARALGSWCCVLAFLGFARQNLNFRTSFLVYANEAVLPFYILHQTVLICVGYVVVPWAVPALLKWLVILPVSLVVIMLVYEFIIRRFNVMRVLSGMKPLANQSMQRTGELNAAR